MSFNLEVFKKELAGAGIVGSLLYMDYMHIDDQPLKFLLMGILGAIAGYGGVQSYQSTKAAPPQQ